MSYIINEVIKTMRELQNYAKKMPLAKLDSKAVKEGLRLSKTVCKQSEFVFATPLMKNLLVAFGDVKQYKGEDGEWHTEKLRAGAESKAVTWVNEVVNALLLKYNGPEKHDYPLDVPVSDPVLYDVDCWNGWKPTIWDIVPGQEEETRLGFKQFSEQDTNISIDHVIELIKKDASLQKAIEVELKIWPMIKASREVKSISDPFMSKKTGVSYPDYHNDSTLVPGTQTTWGKHEIDLCKQAADKGTDALVKFAFDNNVYTGYTRRQRGKGRPLIAQSRRANLVVNLINSVEMEEWKKNPSLNMAFLPEEEILEQFKELGTWMEQHPEYDIWNLDGKKWDQNLGIGWLCLQDALRLMLAQGEYSKALVRCRFAMNSKGYLVDGLNNKVYPIYGRMFSGYLDTTLGNTAADRLIGQYYAISTDPEYVSNVIVPTKYRNVKSVGDDILLVLKQGKLKDAIKVANEKAKIVIHEDEKHARGLMLIQFRAIKLNNEWIMAYNWPRVLRSMLSKEEAKQLGKAGWTLAWYQQLGKLRMYPKMLSIVLNLACAFDKDQLLLKTPVPEIIRMVQDEDNQRLGTANKNGNKARRSTTTAERLFNGNPNIAGIVHSETGKVDFDQNYFVKLQSELNAVYDPDFLTKNGFKAPDISVVH